MKKTKVFYIEDEISLGRIVKDTLENQGYDVRWETDGARVVSQFDTYTPDICILDIMLPGISGLSLCRTIRGLYPVLPIIFLTAKTETSDLVAGFESGGTDYIRKPFSIEELIARIENQLNLKSLRRPGSDAHEPITIGRFRIDPVRYELESPSGIIGLSNREMQVLIMLNGNRNGITRRKEMLMAIWGDDSYVNSRTLDVYIRKLRRYFAPDPGIRIITLKGNGYLFLVS